MSAGCYRFERYRKATGRVSTLAFQTCVEKGAFWACAEQIGGKGNAMLAQQSPSAITTKMLCPVCGGCLRLTVIEPHHNDKRLDDHIFACDKCDEAQTYVFDRT
jgi:hypothetical protein